MKKANVLNFVAKLGYKSAIKAAGVASQYHTYQPQEPKALRELKK
ncbi:MAG TPA: cyclic lactone autoinducer peptide [Clostridiales bacterium]|nr:cyclic lactone autoinducer peptide [Clostridiales bacterium]